jgi:hypothetical protein
MLLRANSLKLWVAPRIEGWVGLMADQHWTGKSRSPPGLERRTIQPVAPVAILTTLSRRSNK